MRPSVVRHVCQSRCSLSSRGLNFGWDKLCSVPYPRFHEKLRTAKVYFTSGHKSNLKMEIQKIPSSAGKYGHLPHYRTFHLTFIWKIPPWRPAKRLNGTSNTYHFEWLLYADKVVNMLLAGSSFFFYRTSLNISCSAVLVATYFLNLAGLGSTLSHHPFWISTYWIKYSWLHSWE